MIEVMLQRRPQVGRRLSARRTPPLSPNERERPSLNKTETGRHPPAGLGRQRRFPLGPGHDGGGHGLDHAPRRIHRAQRADLGGRGGVLEGCLGGRGRWGAGLMECDNVPSEVVDAGCTASRFSIGLQSQAHSAPVARLPPHTPSLQPLCSSPGTTATLSTHPQDVGGLVVVLGAGRDVHGQDHLPPAVQRVAEEVGDLALAVWQYTQGALPVLLVPAQGLQAAAQGHEGGVDGHAFSVRWQGLGMRLSIEDRATG